MKKLARLLLFCCAVLLASCSANLGSNRDAQVPLKPVSCIAVLPASPTVDLQDIPELEKGADFLTEIMARELEGHEKVRLLTENQVASFAPTMSLGLPGMFSAIGREVSCDAVLMTTVSRFKQREGTEYAVEEPASAEFQMKLIHAPTGEVLWTAEFRETQESLLENILSYEKAQRRGFKWVTVEQLVEQEVKERLATCPYLM